MQRDNFTCRHCGCSTNTLNVHHLIYLPDHSPWEYEDEMMITLCEPCHAEEEKLKSEDKLLLGSLLLSGLSRRQMYCLATELRRHMSPINSRNGRFADLMEYLYE